MIPEENAGNARENETMLSTARGNSFIHLFSTGHKSGKQVKQCLCFHLIC